MAWPWLASQELFFSIFLLLLFLYIHYNSYFHSSRKNTKSFIPTNWPIFGMLPGLLVNRHNIFEWLTGVLRSSEGNFFFHGPLFSYFLTSDPANVKHMLVNKFQDYPKGDHFSEIFDDIAGEGIFNAEGDMWKYQRAKVQTFVFHSNFREVLVRFGREKLEHFMLPFLTDAASRCVTIEAQAMFLRLTFDLSCNITLCIDPNDVFMDTPMARVEFARALDVITPSLFYRITMTKAWWKLLRRLGIGKEKKLAEALRIIDSFLFKVIQKRRKDITEGREMSPNLLSSYMHHNSERENTDKFLIKSLLNLFMASRDTTGSALTWLLWSLTQNPRVEEKIITELSSIPKRFISDGMAVFEDEELAKLVYLQAAVLESLRLYPSVPLNLKMVSKPDVLPSGHKLTPGINVVLCMYTMGRMEAIWGKDCCEFIPERWISDNGNLKYEPSYKFMAFNTGPRTCLGKDMSLRFIRIVVAAMVYNFSFQVVEGHVVEPVVSIVFQMKNGLMLKVKKRQTA